MKDKKLLGIVEGFYGVFYTFPERSDLIRFIGEHGYNYYIYAPKNDRQHRARWWEPYPETVMAGFAANVQAARESGVTFSYAISPGGSLRYSSAEDFAHVTRKFQAFYDIGVRAFSLMLDDNEPGFRHAADVEQYASPSAAQADFANRLYAWLTDLDKRCTLSFCPADYSGSAPFSRGLHVLGQELRPEIAIFYTGPEVCSPVITSEHARQFADAVFRKPLIWDNYPVNDLTMQGELHLGPITGRAADLRPAIRGILANPMIQAEASKIPLLTLAEYWHNPKNYHPAAAWDRAIRTVVGDDETGIAAVKLTAENCCISCISSSEAPTLSGLAKAALAALARDENPDLSPAISALEAYLTEIDEATYYIKFRLENLALRNNLLPWIELLEHWMWMTRFSLTLMRAIYNDQPYMNELKRVHEYREAIQTHNRRVGGQSLLPLVELILKRVEQDQRRRVSREWQPSVS